MSKRYRCVKNTGDNFKVGKTYELTERNGLVSESGYEFNRGQCKTAVEWLEKNCGYKFEEVTDMFIKDDLKTGMLVKLRNGSIAIVMRGMVVRKGEEDIEEDAIVGVNESWAIPLSSYEKDLTFGISNRDNDIMLVARACVYPNLEYADEEFTLPSNILYDRSKVEERKRMTVEEIEKQLGYKVTIVNAEGK